MGNDDRSLSLDLLLLFNGFVLLLSYATGSDSNVASLETAILLTALGASGLAARRLSRRRRDVLRGVVSGLAGLWAFVRLVVPAFSVPLELTVGYVAGRLFLVSVTLAAFVFSFALLTDRYHENTARWEHVRKALSWVVLLSLGAVVVLIVNDLWL